VLWALLCAVSRELCLGLRAVSQEVDGWKARAAAIPDPRIRQDALRSLALKRPHLDGAALFWTLPRRRNLALLRLLVSYEIALEFLDELSERVAGAGHRNAHQLHLALAEALDPGASISDYYCFLPGAVDGGYLTALVETCRRHCVSLPSYPRVRGVAVREATRAQVLALNHDPDAARRDAALQTWVAREFTGEPNASWFELSGAATASLTVHVLLALAAEPNLEASYLDRAHAVYFRWCSLAATMLDSYVDQFEDLTSGDHSYIGHYPNGDIAVDRLREIIGGALLEANTLSAGPRHAVLVASMVAMYLSRDSAWVPALRADTRQLIRAGGSLTRLLVPVLRAWRIAYGLRSP
jgi:tetraprenyl-beta-curcumene synthase